MAEQLLSGHALRAARTYGPRPITTVPDPAVVAAAGQHQLAHTDRFWDIVLGTGYRATVDALGQEQRDRVRGWLLSELRSLAVTAVRTDVVFGTARRSR